MVYLESKQEFVEVMDDAALLLMETSYSIHTNRGCTSSRSPLMPHLPGVLQLLPLVPEPSFAAVLGLAKALGFLSQDNATTVTTGMPHPDESMSNELVSTARRIPGLTKFVTHSLISSCQKYCGLWL
jgi:hypothetical protein